MPVFSQIFYLVSEGQKGPCDAEPEGRSKGEHDVYRSDVFHACIIPHSPRNARPFFGFFACVTRVWV